MQLIEWEVEEDNYQEQIIIPKEQRDIAAKEGINTEEKQKVAVQILNLNTGESYTGRNRLGIEERTPVKIKRKKRRRL